MGGGGNFHIQTRKDRHRKVKFEKGSRVADPDPAFHFKQDPDSAFNCSADPDPEHYQG